MCLFNKKEKEKIAILEQKVNNLENQINELLEMIDCVQTATCEVRQIINNHIANDKDMIEDDGTEWGEN